MKYFRERFRRAENRAGIRFATSPFAAVNFRDGDGTAIMVPKIRKNFVSSSRPALSYAEGAR